MIRVKHKGDFSKTITFLKKSETLFQNYNFSRFGEEAINALADATPKDTGLTSQSWVYKIEKTKTKVKISFYNTNIQNGVIIAFTPSIRARHHVWNMDRGTRLHKPCHFTRV